jgi:hypothetical protein
LRRRIGVCEIVPGGFEEVEDVEENEEKEDEVAIIVGSDTMKAIKKRRKRTKTESILDKILIDFHCFVFTNTCRVLYIHTQTSMCST